VPKPRLTKGDDEELRLLERIGLVPSPLRPDVLEFLRERTAAASVCRWDIRGRPRLAVCDPALALEIVRPRIQSLALPVSRDPRERRWASTFLAESARGGGARTDRLTETARHAWREPGLVHERDKHRERFFARFRPGVLLPLGRELHEYALRTTVLWTEGRDDEESVRILKAAVGGDESAARRYRQRLGALAKSGGERGLLASGEAAAAWGSDAVADAAVFAELAARVLADLLHALARVLCGEAEGSGPLALLERVLRDAPPWWIHVRETTHEYRLGVQRLPAGTRIFVPVPLLGEGGGTPTDASELRRVLALGANLCPSLGLLLDEARHFAEGLAEAGRLEPVAAVRFSGADGRYVSDPMGIHVR